MAVWSQAQLDFYTGKITIDDLVASQEDAQHRVDDAEKENAKLKQQLKQKDQAFEGANTLLPDAAKQEIADLWTKISDLENQLSESYKENEEIKGLEEHIAELEKAYEEIKRLEEKNEKLRIQLQEKNEMLMTEISSLKRGSKSTTDDQEKQGNTSGDELVLRQSRPGDKIEQGKDQEIVILRSRVSNLESQLSDAESEVTKQIEDIDRLESDIEDLKEQVELCHQHIERPTSARDLFPKFDPQHPGPRIPDPDGLFGTGNNKGHNSFGGAGPNSAGSLDIFAEHRAASGEVLEHNVPVANTGNSLFSGTKNDHERSSRLFNTPSSPAETKTDQSLDQAREMKKQLARFQAKIVDWSERYNSSKILKEALAHQGGQDVLELVEDFVILKDGRMPFDTNDEALDGQSCSMLLQAFATHSLLMLVNPESGREEDLDIAREAAMRVVRLAKWHFIEEKDHDDAESDLVKIAYDFATSIAPILLPSPTRYHVFTLNAMGAGIEALPFSLNELLEAHKLHARELAGNPKALDERSLIVVVSPIIGVVGESAFVGKGIVYMGPGNS